MCHDHGLLLYCLQSANFGKGFLGPDVPEDVVNDFVTTGHQLRVLNNVRDEQIGIPITLRQYPMSRACGMNECFGTKHHGLAVV